MSELMSDAAIKAHMRREYIVVCVYYAQLGERGEQFVQMFLTLRDDFLIPNLQYLAEIGRLPEEFDTEECNLSLIEKMLALP